jgi:hypothetical protein
MEMYQREEREEMLARVGIHLANKSNQVEIGKYYKLRERVNNINVISLKRG